MLESLLFTLFLTFLILYIKKSKQVDKEKVSLEDQKRKLSEEINNLESNLSKLKIDHQDITQKYQEEIKQKEDEIKELEVKEDLALFDLYVNRYDFDGSDKYKNLLDDVINNQKNLRKEKKAVYATTEWQVNGSKTEGRKMTNNIIKLISMAFDGECDVLMTKVKFNNILKIEEKIRK